MGSSPQLPALPRSGFRGLTRRRLLAGGAASAATLVLSRCGTVSRRPKSCRRLAPVLVAEDRIIRTVVGFRPFRPAGFRLEAASYDGKLVVHNYGHGGGGVSLSWGTAHLAAEHVLAAGATSAAVLGCGAVGLATARLLQDRGVAVTIYARDLPPNTTSNLAGAEWWPYYVADEDRRTGDFDAQFEQASRFAFRYFQNLVGPRYGVRWLEAYTLSNNPPHPGPETIDSRILDLAPRTLVAAGEHPFPVATVRRFHTMHVETSVYLAALLTDFRLAGGRVVVRDLPDAVAVLALAEPVVVNCTGLGARELFGDAEILPVKGQLSVLVPQPEVDYMTFGPERLYMIPRNDGILLGGTAERGVETREPNADAARRILEGHRQLFDGMRRAAMPPASS